MGQEINFKKIWESQKEQNQNIKAYPNFAPLERVKQFCLELVGEIHEFLNDIGYKVFKSRPDFINSNVLEEWIDIFKYWMTIGQELGFTLEDLEKEYYRKTSVINVKVDQKRLLRAQPQMAIIDIDGVLIKYAEGFNTWMRHQTGSKFEPKSYDIYDEWGKLIGYKKFNDLLHKFRETGMKRYLYPYPYAKEFLQNLKQKNYAIVLLTARPVHKYKRMFADTIQCLKENELFYDVIFWYEHKDYEALKQFDHIEFVVEDNLKQAQLISSLGHEVFLIDKPYNQVPFDIEKPVGMKKPLIHRVNSLKELESKYEL